MVRANDATFPAGGCTTGITAGTCWIDTDTPGLGAVFYYLVRSTAPFTGSFGQDSANDERTLACVP